MKTAEVVKDLRERFKHAYVEEVHFQDQITVQLHKEALKETLSFLKQTPEPGYEVLMDLTAVDYLEPIKQTKIVYWLHNPTNLERLRIIVFAKREEEIPSVSSLWAGADWYEREIFDLFGVRFTGHPALKRILMPDNWEGHPLRRDYPLTEEPVEFKHNVKPKVPSKIINYDKNKNIR